MFNSSNKINKLLISPSGDDTNIQNNIENTSDNIDIKKIIELTEIKNNIINFIDKTNYINNYNNDLREEFIKIDNFFNYTKIDNINIIKTQLDSYEYDKYDDLKGFLKCICINYVYENVIFIEQKSGKSDVSEIEKIEEDLKKYKNNEKKTGSLSSQIAIDILEEKKRLILS